MHALGQRGRKKPPEAKPSRGGVDKIERICYNTLQRVLHIRQAVGHTTRKGVRLVRITLHIGAYTVTIVVRKRENRHSAK